MGSMNYRESLIWAAGVIEGCGVVAVTIEQGPTRMYHAIGLLAVTGNPDVNDRLIDAVGNGDVIMAPSGDPCFELGGYAAIRGFLADIWPFLTPHKRTEINSELRRYKLLKSGKLGS